MVGTDVVCYRNSKKTHASDWRKGDNDWEVDPCRLRKEIWTLPSVLGKTIGAFEQ